MGGYPTGNHLISAREEQVGLNPLLLLAWVATHTLESRPQCPAAHIYTAKRGPDHLETERDLGIGTYTPTYHGWQALCPTLQCVAALAAYAAV